MATSARLLGLANGRSSGRFLLWIGMVLSLGWATQVFAEVARPADTGTGPAVARVHLRGGTACQIRAAGKTFAAQVGLPLLASDEMLVPVGEFLVVSLSNGHLVRIDEDIEMRVSEIVLLNAPPTRESLGKQLDRLLTREERIRSERISGVQARRQGADEMPAESLSMSRLKPSESRKADRSLSLSDPSPAAPEPVAAPPPPAPTASMAAGAPPPPPPPAPSRTRGMPPSPAKPTVAQGPIAPATEDAIAKIEITKQPPLQLPEPAALQKCLRRALLPSIKQVTIELKLRGGHIERVRLRGGLVTPACMSSLLLHKPLQGTEQKWLGSEIVLH